METKKSNHMVLAYGFEINKIIVNDNKCCIGKSIHGKIPVYSSLMITDKDMDSIKNKMCLMKLHYDDYLLKIDKLAKIHGAIPKWQLVFYNKNFEYYVHLLQGKKFNYDSEMYPCY